MTSSCSLTLSEQKKNLCGQKTECSRAGNMAHSAGKEFVKKHRT